MTGSADRPQWIPIQEMVPEGSIGEELLSRIPDLGARLRPETIFEQSLRPSLFVRENPDLSTYGNILRLPAESLATFSPKFKLPARLDDYLRGLSTLPHSRLLAAIYGRPQFSAPLDREQEIVEGVESILDQMPDKRMLTVIVLRFGLYDGITRTLKEIGRRPEERVAGERVRQIEGKGLRYLRHQSPLEKYLVLPEVSLGREVFGAVLGADLPELDGGESKRALHISRDIAEKLNYLPPYGLYSYFSIRDLVMADLSQAEYADITGPVKDEIASALQRRAREVEDKLRVEVEQQALDEAQNQAEIVELRNSLLPEIELSHQLLERVDDVLLTDLGLPTRWRNALKGRKNDIITVGALLRMNRQRLQDIYGVGVKAEAEIIEKLTAFLKSQ